MIVAVNGIPKTGSSLMYFYIREIISSFYSKANIDWIYKQTESGSIQGKKGFISNPTDDILESIYKHSTILNPIPIKTHIGFNPQLESFVFQEKLKMILTYRDPRDILLSGFDHYNRTAQTSNIQFQSFNSFDNGIKEVNRFFSDFKVWFNNKKVIKIKYKDLLEHPVESLLYI